VLATALTAAMALALRLASAICDNGGIGVWPLTTVGVVGCEGWDKGVPDRVAGLAAVDCPSWAPGATPFELWCPVGSGDGGG
jgi:hypothetical protein